MIERRLKDAFPGIQFEVHGTPKDIGGARDLANRDKYQFQWWAVSLVDAVPQGERRRVWIAGLMDCGGCGPARRMGISRKCWFRLKAERMLAPPWCGITIAGLLAGQKPDLPSPARGEGFKQAPKESGIEKQSKLKF